MPVFTRLIQTATSPEKSLKALSSPAKYNQATFARLADVNDLAKDQNDQKLYSITSAGSATTFTQAITSKRGVVKISGSTSTGSLTVTLTTASTSELLIADADNYFVQATVTCGTTNLVAYAMAKPIGTDNQIAFTLVQTGTAIAWGTVYLNYTIVKIGD